MRARAGRRLLLIATGLVPCLAGGGLCAGAPVSIVAPDANEILYGSTRIRVVADRHATRVDIFLDRYPSPICSFREPPYECDFDAGTRLESRVLRARAFGAEGRFLGQDSIVTYSFIDAERVVAGTLTVPLVASVGEGAPPDLHDTEWTCRYGEEACEVVAIRKLGDNVTGMARQGLMRGARSPMVELAPVSLEVLIDVSPSVWADRKEIDDALRRVIDDAPTAVEISISEFAGIYNRLVPFTTSKSQLRRGLRQMSERQPWSCVLGAVRRALSELHARPGHKALFLISDTEETCEARGYQRSEQTSSDLADDEDALDATGRRQVASWAQILARRKAINRTLELSRQVGIPIYVYRVGGDAVTSQNAVEAFREMAEESGGRWLSGGGDLSGLRHGLGALLEDLESTWILDIALPAFAIDEHEARLSLSAETPKPIELRYPDRWRGGNRESLLLTLLQLGDAEARGWSAEQLRNSRNRKVLRALLAAYRTESSAANRIEQMTAVYHVSAYLLLHGDGEDKRAALGTIEELWEIDPILVRRLRPALRTFQKMDVPRKLRLKAERLAEPTVPPRTFRPERQG